MNMPNDVIDWVTVQERFEGDLALFCEIARLFIQDSPKRLSVMHDALSCGDGKTLELVAHSLRGSVGNFAASEASEAAQALEDVARSGDMQRASEACERLEVEVNRLTVALAEVDRLYCEAGAYLGS